MPRITESELILPSLYIISNNKTKKLNTSNLINKLRELLNPWEEDTEILEWRKDDKFSQKVRNLRAHRTLEKDWLTEYRDKHFYITSKWEEFLKENSENLKLIIEEEHFLNKMSETINDYYNEFKKSISRVKQLSSIEKFTRKNLKEHFYNMLFSSLITSLETYLSDALKFHINKNDEYRIKFVETFKDFQEVKCSFNNIFNLCETIDNKIEENLLKLLYHNLPKINWIYKSTFDIKFQDISSLMSDINIRHDLVHRNWKNKVWKKHNISKKDILDLSDKLLWFVSNIEEQFKNLDN